MDGALSQEEINALLSNPGDTLQETEFEALTDDEKDFCYTSAELFSVPLSCVPPSWVLL